MKHRFMFVVVTLVCGISAFVAGPLIWPPVVAPESRLLPFFLFLALCESLAFGLGIAFLIFGWSLLKPLVGVSRRMTWAMFISIAWLLISWWPHGKLHAANKTLVGLLYIEYGFHLTLLIAGCILAYCFIRLLSPVAMAMPVSASPRPTLARSESAHPTAAD